MYQVRLFAASLALTLLLAPSVGAQTPTPPRFEDQVVVTPNRSETSVDGVPAYVTLLDQDDIAASSAQDVPDLLRQAGISVTDLNGTGRSYRVDLRGFGATGGLNTLVLVDGRPINQPDLSGTDWSLIPLNRVVRIEVIRGGAGAVTFGDNASGGVINIVTMASEPKGSQAVADLRAGSYDTFTTQAAATGARGPISYSVSGRYNTSEGYRDNAQTDGGDIGGQFGIRPNEKFELNVSAGYHGDTSGSPGALTETELLEDPNRRRSEHEDDVAEVDDSYLMITPKVTLGSKGYASLDFSLRNRDSSFFSTFIGGDFTGNTGTRTIALSPKIALQLPAAGMTHQLVAGFDYSNSTEDISNTTVFDGFPSVGLFTLEKADSGFYVQDEARIGRASVTAGYRYDAADYSFDPSEPSEADYSEYGASVGAAFVVGKNATLFGRVSRSFRYPVLDELFDFFGNTIQTNLVPQRSVDVEGGVRFESERVQGNVSVFRLSTDDELFYNPIGGAFGFGANENFDGTTRRTGFEASASTQVERVRLGGTITFLATDIDGGPYDGNSVPGVPGTRATFQVQTPIVSHFTLGFEGQYVGARPFEGDFAGAFPDQDDYFVMNSKIAYSRGRARIFVDVKNLFDAEYSEYGVLGGFPTQRAYYPSPGIHAIVGAELTF